MKLSRDIAVGMQILLENKGSLTSQDLIQHLGISRSQAYERLTLCRHYLKECEISFFSPKRKGLIQLEPQSQKQLEQLLLHITSTDREFSASDRRRFLFFELFRTPYLKNHQICQMLDISRNTCINDIALLSEELQQAGFDVKVNSSVNGYSLNGKESDLRKALVWQLSCVACWTHPGEGYPLKSRIGYAYYGLPYQQICSISEKLTKDTRHMHISLSEQSIFHIASVFSLWICRWDMGNYLRETAVDMSLCDLHGKQNLYWLLQDAGIEQLGKILRKDTSIPPSERISIIQAETEELIRAIICISSIFEEYPEKLLFFSNKIEDAIFNLMHLGGNTIPNSTLVERTVRQYLQGTLCRIAFGYRFYRAEGNLIRRDFHYLMEQIREAVLQLPSLAQGRDDGEMVGLTLHYIGWMSGNDKKTESPDSDAPRVGIVCANAIGIGGLLQTQIHHYFPEVATKLIPLSRLKTLPEENCILISTLALNTSRPYLRVNALLTPYDQYRIQKQLHQYSDQTGRSVDILKDIQQIVQDFVDEDQLPLLNMRLEQLFANKKFIMIKEQSAMLTDLITRKRIQCVESVTDWKDAIRTASIPLIEDGSIRNSYVDAMIESVETIGPYIVLAPGIALPHARPEAGVQQLGMALLRTQTPVYFDDTRYANLFFVLASADGKSHMNALIQLSRIFGCDGVFETFMEAQDAEELWELLNRQS